MATMAPHLAQYERDFASQTGSGIHTFTEEHQTKNRTLQSLLLDILPLQDINKTNDCDMIYRYLIARHWNVEAAHQSVRQYIKWRKDENIDAVMWETFDQQVESCIASYFGVDKEGYPVLWDAPNPKLVAQVLKSFPKEVMLRAHYKLMENARYLSRTNGVDRITYVLDLTAVTISSVNSDSIGFLKEMSKMDQLYYPEVMRRMLICNGGWAVTAAWKVIRPLLDERIQKKIQFLKDEPSVALLKEYLEAEHVHAKYGGTGKGWTSKGSSLADQIALATSGPAGTLKYFGGVDDNGATLLGSAALTRLTLSSTYDEEANDDTGNNTPDSPDDDEGKRPPPFVQGGGGSGYVSSLADEEFYSLSDEDEDHHHPSQQSITTTKISRSPTTATTTIGAASVVPRRGVTDDVVLMQPPTTLRGRQNNVIGSRGETASASLPEANTKQKHSAAEVVVPRPPLTSSSPSTKKILTPGRLGDGTAVEIEIHRHGKTIRGFHVSRLVGESQDNLIVSYLEGQSFSMSSANTMDLASQQPSVQIAPGGGATRGGSASPTREGSSNHHQPVSRVLIGELLRESGHPLHTHLIVSDASRTAKFILMQRNLHKQIVIYQVVGDCKIHTNKSFKHTVLGEKVRMARCGEREESTDARDWVVWGKVRVGTQEVRKYLAEKQGWTLIFYDTLAALPIQDLFCLGVGLMELWEE